MLNQMQMQEMMKQQYLMGQMAYSPPYQAAAAGSSPVRCPHPPNPLDIRTFVSDCLRGAVDAGP